MSLPRPTVQPTDPAPGAEAPGCGAAGPGFAESGPEVAGTTPGFAGAPGLVGPGRLPGPAHWGAVPWRLSPGRGDACCPRQVWAFARLPI